MKRISLDDRLNVILDGLGYDFARFNIDDFVRWVATRRGRPIHLVPMRLPPELFGAWIKAARDDYIFYEAGPPQVHSVHILLHELSHLLLNHQTVQVSDNLALLLHHDVSSPGGLPSPLTQQVLHGLFRTIRYTDDREAETETLSGLIQSRVFRLAGIAALTHASQDPAIMQFVHSMGFDR